MTIENAVRSLHQLQKVPQIFGGVSALESACACACACSGEGIRSSQECMYVHFCVFNVCVSAICKGTLYTLGVFNGNMIMVSPAITAWCHAKGS